MTRTKLVLMNLVMIVALATIVAASAHPRLRRVTILSFAHSELDAYKPPVLHKARPVIRVCYLQDTQVSCKHLNLIVASGLVVASEKARADMSQEIATYWMQCAAYTALVALYIVDTVCDIW